MEPEAPAGAHRPAGAPDRTRTSVPARNLVFLIDVSGSMSSPDKLPLVRQGAAHARRQPDAPTIASPSWSTRARADWCCRRRPAIARSRIHRRASPISKPAARPTAAQGIELAYAIAREQLHPGRHQPRDPRDRRRLQRRRHERGRAGPPDRGEARRAACSSRCSASAPATSRTRRWRSSPTRATATTPTSTRCTRRARCS